MKFLLSLLAFAATAFAEGKQWATYPGKDGPGKGKRIVLLAGDEEYRSEEGLPQLAKILSQRHGFDCTVIFSINKDSGEIDPLVPDNEPGIEALDSADLCVMLLRFRNWPDAQMKHFADYLAAGKPFIALRTSTHAFKIEAKESPYAKYSYNSKAGWPGGFGRHVLGETWVAHHGAHKKEATRGIVEPAAKGDPLLRGVADLFGNSDVYTARPLEDAKILVRGQVLEGMNANDAPVAGPKNEPMQPIVWTREFKNDAGTTNKVLTTTMGAATDLENEGLRRLIVNAAYSFTGLEVPAHADVAIVGEYEPSFYGFGGFKKGARPADLESK